MTTLDAIILLLLIEALLAYAWRQACRARRYDRTPLPPPQNAPEPPQRPGGPVL